MGERPPTDGILNVIHASAISGTRLGEHLAASPIASVLLSSTGQPHDANVAFRNLIQQLGWLRGGKITLPVVLIDPFMRWMGTEPTLPFVLRVEPTTDHPLRAHAVAWPVNLEKTVGYILQVIDWKENAETKRGTFNLSELVNQLPIGVAVYGPSLELIVANNEARMLAEQLGSTLDLQPYLHNPSGPWAPLTSIVAQGVRDATAGSKVTIWQQVFPNISGIVGENGKRVDQWILNLTFSPIGSQSSVICILEDTTYETELQHGRQRSLRLEAVNRVADGMAHTINNLMTVVTGYGGLLQGSLPDGHPDRAMLTEILAASERATSLANRVLSFSRDNPHANAIVDLAQTLESVRGVLEKLAGPRIQIAINLHQGPAVIFADPGKLNQSIMNLVSNSIDALPDGGYIIINTRLVETLPANLIESDIGPGPYVVLSVIDNGIGMTENQKERLFEPFFSTKSDTRSLGLGLPVVKSLVSQAQGTVEVSSAPGLGTTVRLYFPAIPSERPTIGVQKERRPVSLNILLVEDQIPVRTLATTILRRLGHEVIEASNGQTAINCLVHSTVPIDVIVTDIIMPGMDGFQLADQVWRANDQQPFLFVSGVDFDHQWMESNRGRCLGVLRKPFTDVQLRSALDKLVDQARTKGYLSR